MCVLDIHEAVAEWTKVLDRARFVTATGGTIALR